MAKNGTSKKATATPLPEAVPPKWDAGDMLKAKKRLVHSLTICLDSELATAKIKAAKALEEAQQAHDLRPNANRLAEAYATAKVKYDLANEAAMAKSVEFVAQAIPRVQYDEMCKNHRPTIEQIADWEKTNPGQKLKFNSKTFPPLLMSTCMVEPQLTVEQANEIWNEWSDGEAATVFDLCLRTQKIVL